MDSRSRTGFGGFLDTWPKALYVLAHVAFLVVGIVLWRQAAAASPSLATALALYVVSQLVFLVFFANLITMKMAVLVEQMLVLAMVYLVATASL